MKTVFDNAMVAHVWAQQTQETGRSSNGNLRFEGPTLYSYSTPIAEFVTAAWAQESRRVCLIDSGSYSISTSKHQRLARQAVSGCPVFCVPYLPTDAGRSRNRPRGSNIHALNLAALIADYQADVSKSKHAQPNEWMRPRLQNSVEYIRRFAETFGLLAGEIDLDADLRAITEHWDARAAKRNTPAQIAKRERDAARKAEQKAEQERIERAVYTDNLSAWLAGATIETWRLHSETVRLRVRNERLETSMGASVPLAHAKRVFGRAMQCRTAQTGWHRNGETIPVGAFQVDAIYPDGSFKAGCHLILWPEIERVAASIGLINRSEVAD